MPRYRREKSESGVYHIMVRGIDRMSIFQEEEDYKQYLETLLRFKKSNNYELCAYCLMSNHVHLLIKEVDETIERLMKRLGVSYVYYFNRKYNRVGHLFQDRYKSESIDTEQYLLECCRYIHNNPVKAGLVKLPEEYLWSSYMHYQRKTDKDLLMNTNLILDHFSANRTEAILKLKEFTESRNQDKYLDYEDDNQLRLGESQKVINEILEKHSISLEDLRVTKDVWRRNAILQEIKSNSNASVREISRLLEISKDIVFRA
ncbi:transposase [Shimazuella sp. AN120528]|uniref:REP-associated tyrosine transposase n=1 Tax=Shimazuella soli TaxID=1892854 RepID=UPI001F0E3CF3|nr:transposase [Shimazuella soli]MCH5586550.1 transposase [Shimazuella soli]